MQATALSDGKGERLKLPGVLDLSAAEAFLDHLQSKAGHGHALRLDASAVETLTLPCIQIILAAVRSHEFISISSPSAEFMAAFKDLGLDWGRTDTEAPEERAGDPSGRPAPGAVAGACVGAVAEHWTWCRSLHWNRCRSLRQNRRLSRRRNNWIECPNKRVMPT